MKRLLDQNRSPRLSILLAALDPGTCHVQDVGVEAADDPLVWEHALAAEFTIVSKDDDFRELSARQGHPPKVVRLDFDNCSTAAVEAGLRHYCAALYTFRDDPVAGYLELPPP